MLSYVEEVKQKTDDMLKHKYIIKQKHCHWAENFENPCAPSFYGLKKLHKLFNSFPSLQPIVSGFNSCTCNLSKFVDFFLKFYAPKWKSYIRDTKSLKTYYFTLSLIFPYY